MCRHRQHVDDRARRLALQEMGDQPLHKEEGAAHIGVEDLVEKLFRGSTSDPRADVAAALTSALRVPKCESAVATARLQSATLETSALMKIASTPDFLRVATALSPFSCERPMSARARQPSSANASATAKPMPCAPPVMMARVCELRSADALIALLLCLESCSYLSRRTVLPVVADFSAASASFSATRPSAPLGAAFLPEVAAVMKAAISRA